MNTQEIESLSQHNIVAFLEDIFQRRGSEEYLGEPVTMAEHMLQGATLAMQQNEEEIIIVATLLHDIGHFTSEFGMFTMSDQTDRYHEQAGAEILGAFFPDTVVSCVRLHVAAKRYLCATNTAYFDQLSSASVHSLHLQGGPMSGSEVAEFEKNPELDNIIKVRYFDDAAKDASMSTPPFAYFAPMIQSVVNKHINP